MLASNSNNECVTIGENRPHLFHQVFKSQPILNFMTEIKDTEDGIKSVYVRSNKINEEKERIKDMKRAKKKKKKNKRKHTSPIPRATCKEVMRNNGTPCRNCLSYMNSGFQYSGFCGPSKVLPRYLNSTVATEMKKVNRDYWPCHYLTPSPFVVGTSINATHNVFLLKQETCAKIRTAKLPFTKTELNDQSINSLRSIKRSVEKYWKL